MTKKIQKDREDNKRIQKELQGDEDTSEKNKIYKINKKIIIIIIKHMS